MIDQLVSFETAKLAKEKGFTGEKTNFVYTDTKEIRKECGFMNYPKNLFPTYIRLPTQSQLQRWLREVHHIHISIFRGDNGYAYNIVEDNGERIIIHFDSDKQDKFEIILEQALTESLKLIP